jgi:hypothetical protein
MHLPKNLSLSLILLATAAAAHADIITFTETINGVKGFLSENAFPFNYYTLVNSPVTITGTGDTSAITRGAQGQYDLILSSATLSVFGFPTDTIIGSLEVTVDNQQQTAGFFNLTLQHEAIISSPVFSTYNPTEPVTGTGNPYFDRNFEVLGSMYSLLLTGNSSPATFSAQITAAPDPSTWTLAGISMLGLARMIVRRKPGATKLAA